MDLLRLKLDAFHCALLVLVVLLAVYGFGRFREGASRGNRRSHFIELIEGSPVETIQELPLIIKN